MKQETEKMMMNDDDDNRSNMTTKTRGGFCWLAVPSRCWMLLATDLWLWKSYDALFGAAQVPVESSWGCRKIRTSLSLVVALDLRTIHALHARPAGPPRSTRRTTDDGRWRRRRRPPMCRRRL